jgi:hypothetical protein
VIISVASGVLADPPDDFADFVAQSCDKLSLTARQQGICGNPNCNVDLATRLLFQSRDFSGRACNRSHSKVISGAAPGRLELAGIRPHNAIRIASRIANPNKNIGENLGRRTWDKE